MSPFFIHYLTLWRPLGYGLVFFGLVFEGDLFLLTTAFLTRLGFFDIFDMLFIVLAGAIASDIFWYWLGQKAGESPRKFLQKLSRLAAGIDIDFEKNFFRKLLISKFAYGTHHLVLVKIGMLGLPFKKYLKNDLPASIIWVLGIGFLGYVFAGSYLLVKHYFKYVEVGVLFFLAVFIILNKIIKKCLKKSG